MDGRALIRLRIAFVLLAAALLAPLGLLARSMEARLEAQRRLRHEIVAERIFDEMERELTALLATESARPSDAYSAASTRVENWAPFVVGYFTRDAAGVHVVAQSQMDDARSARLLRALPSSRVSSAEPQPPHQLHPRANERVVGLEESELGGLAKEKLELAPRRSEKKRFEAEAKSSTTSVVADKPLGERAPAAEILKQLNRGGGEREKVQRKLDSKRGATTSADPLADSW